MEDSGHADIIIITMDEYKWLVEYNEEMRKHII